MKKKMFLLLTALISLLYMSCQQSEADMENEALANELVGLYTDSSVIHYNSLWYNDTWVHNGYGVIVITKEENNIVKLNGYLKERGLVDNGRLLINEQHKKSGYVTYSSKYDPIDLTNVEHLAFVETINGFSQENADSVKKYFITTVEHKLNKVNMLDADSVYEAYINSLYIN